MAVRLRQSRVEVVEKPRPRPDEERDFSVQTISHVSPAGGEVVNVSFQMRQSSWNALHQIDQGRRWRDFSRIWLSTFCAR